MTKLFRKTVLTLVLAFALLALGLQASVWMPPAANGGIDLLANYSAIPMQSEAKAALLAKNNGSKTYHLPSGNFVGAKMVLKDPKTVGTTTVSSAPMALAIVFDFAPNAADATDIVPGTNLYTPVPVSYFWNLLYGTTYNPYSLADFSKYATYKATPSSTPVDAPTNRTLKNYLLEVSDGRITDFTGDVVRVTLPGHYSDYFIGKTFGLAGVDNANGDYIIAKILEEAVAAADPYVDFSLYGEAGKALKNVFFIHAGSGAEWNGASDIIWSHSWEYASAYCYYMYAKDNDPTWLTDDNKYDAIKGILADGVYVNDYSIEPEVGGDLTGFTGAVSGPFPPDVGVYAHEYAHVLGAPDEYDYGYESEGTGIYSLMSSGSWTRWPNAPQYSGNTPVMLDAWCRIYLGFASGTDLTTVTARGTSASYTLEPVSVGGGVLKLVVPGTGGSEYFLVENRQQVAGTFDMGLGRSSSVLRIDGSKIHGLAIYHVDENVLARNFSRSSEAPATSQKTEWNMSVDKANGEWHYGVSILQADGRWQLERGTGYYGENHLYKAGFSFGPKTYPASSSYFTNFAVQGKNISPNYSGVFVKNIVENSDGTVTFTAGIE